MNKLMVASSMCLLLAVFFLETEGAMFFERDARHPDDPTRCYTKVYNQSLEINKLYNTPHCTRMQCSKDFVVSFASCGAVGVPKGCYLTKENFKLPYPRCCPQIVCDDNYSSDEDGEINMIL